MLSKTRLGIMIRAAKIRMSRGEELEDILAGWMKLTDEDKDLIRAEVLGNE
ncbi:MAG: hypothetical protein ACTTHL_01085 [Oribacterium sp.]